MLADVLAKAFYDDPPLMWMLPDGKTRHARTRGLFTTVLRAEALRHGAVEAVWDGELGGIVGGAIWFPPGTWPSPVRRQLAALPGYARALGRRFGPASDMLAALARAHPRSPHWYLYAIGVDPAYQGRVRAARCCGPVSPASTRRARRRTWSRRKPETSRFTSISASGWQRSRRCPAASPS